MQADWLFWAIAAILVVGCLGTVFAPLLLGAGRADRRASYDIRVHRDQLREIDADLARGVLQRARGNGDPARGVATAALGRRRRGGRDRRDRGAPPADPAPCPGDARPDARRHHRALRLARRRRVARPAAGAAPGRGRQAPRRPSRPGRSRGDGGVPGGTRADRRHASGPEPPRKVAGNACRPA